MSGFNPQEHMTNLKGKDYLEVKWRLVWFRDEHPLGAVTTDVISYEPLLVKAFVHTAEGALLATGHASAVAKQGAVWSGRDFEKAETAAIGRALGHAGYGTQFEPDGEGDYLADSPVEKPVRKAALQATNNAPATTKASSQANTTKTPQKGDKRAFDIAQVETALTKDGKPYYNLIATDNTIIATFSRDIFRVWGYTDDVTAIWQKAGHKYDIEIPMPIEAKLVERKDKKGTVWAAIIPEVEF